jgi:regulator of sigma E protease
MLTVFVAFISLIILVSLHELGHFLTAKKFGVKIEEFGIGYPPRLFSKKLGETIYSVNLLPFGAFVRIPEEESSEPSSFSNKPLWQKVLIIFNGAAVFWLVAMVLFSTVFLVGAPAVVEDSQTNLKGLKVQISIISPDSPAQTAGLKVGDTITALWLKNEDLRLEVDKVVQVQEYMQAHKGQEITMAIQRGKNTLNVNLTPRASPPAGQGPLGIGLVRTALKTYPWYSACFEGFKATLEMTWMTIVAYAQAIAKLFKGVPTGLQMMGPVGIVGLLSQGAGMGLTYFLQMIALLSINVSLINLLPIPAFDGGKLMFLSIGAIRRKPVPRQIEEKITTAFFILLIVLMIFVSIKDVRNFGKVF